MKTYENLVTDRLKECEHIIFLDIDGVLNNEKCMLNSEHLDMDCVRYIRKIVNHVPNCGIVVSSTWRIGLRIQEILEMFSWVGIYSIVGRTKQLTGIRGDEVADFVKTFAINKYVIIDDDSDFTPEQIPYFIKTDGYIGITEKQADQVIKDIFKIKVEFCKKCNGLGFVGVTNDRCECKINTIGYKK